MPPIFVQNVLMIESAARGVNRHSGVIITELVSKTRILGGATQWTSAEALSIIQPKRPNGADHDRYRYLPD